MLEMYSKNFNNFTERCDFHLMLHNSDFAIFKKQREKINFI